MLDFETCDWGSYSPYTIVIREIYLVFNLQKEWMHNWRNWRREICSRKVRWWRELTRRRKKDWEERRARANSERSMKCAKRGMFKVNKGMLESVYRDAASVGVHRGFHNVHTPGSHSFRSLLGSSKLQEVGSVMWRDVRSKVYTDPGPPTLDLIVLLPHHVQNSAASPVGNTWKRLEHPLLTLWLNF